MRNLPFAHTSLKGSQNFSTLVEQYVVPEFLHWFPYQLTVEFWGFEILIMKLAAVFVILEYYIDGIFVRFSESAPDFHKWK